MIFHNQALLMALVLVGLIQYVVPVDATTTCNNTASETYESRGPILITSDADLAAGALTGANGVRGGTGTENDPFVIADWTIDASPAIVIRGTSASILLEDLIIRGNVEILGSSPIELERVQIEDAELHAQSPSIVAEQVTVRNSVISIGTPMLRVNDSTILGKPEHPSPYEIRSAEARLEDVFVLPCGHDEVPIRFFTDDDAESVRWYSNGLAAKPGFLVLTAEGPGNYEFAGVRPHWISTHSGPSVVVGPGDATDTWPVRRVGLQGGGDVSIEGASIETMDVFGEESYRLVLIESIMKGNRTYDTAPFGVAKDSRLRLECQRSDLYPAPNGQWLSTLDSGALTIVSKDCFFDRGSMPKEVTVEGIVLDKPNMSGARPETTEAPNIPILAIVMAIVFTAAGRRIPP